MGPNLSERTTCPSHISYKGYLTTPTTNRFQFKTITPTIITEVINSLKPKGSCNTDRISSRLLKHIKNEIASPLSQIFNQSVDHSIFPDILKKAMIIPIYKNKERDQFCNYRPISILSSVSKVFEKIMLNQLTDHFTKLGAIYQSQYGFRKLHSTELATLELVDRVTYAMDQNLLPINIYLDLSKAFDTLDHQILLNKLQYYGIHDKPLSFLKSYLTERTQQLRYGESISEPLLIKCGVPQGSILGPLLFTIYINDITNASSNFYPILYADDTTLCATLNSNHNTSETNVLNEDLESISHWLKANKLSVNASKTKAMLFRTTQRHVQHPELYLDNVKIDFVDNFNFLGFIVNQNLKWNPHIDMLAKKISKTIGIMKRLRNTLPHNTLLHIYNALISSYLNYGNIIWGERSNKLFKLQKKALRVISKSKYNSHTSPLFKQLGILKLSDLCALHDFKFCYKFGNDMLPKYFSSKLFFRYPTLQNRCTRQSNNLRLPAVSHEFAKCSISYKFPKTFNNMEPTTKEKIDTHSLSGFKNYVKQKLLQTYPTECKITNCYVCG